MRPDERLIRKKKDTPESSLIAVKPQAASIWFDKGRDMIEKSMYAEAVRCFRQALGFNQDSAGVWFYMGLAMERMMRLSDAVKCYDMALEINPGNESIIYNKAIALGNLGDSSEAIRCYDTLIQLNPEDTDAWRGKADSMLENGDAEGAVSVYDRMLGIDPDDVAAWNNRGIALEKLNLFSEAIDSYEKALDIDPKIEKIWSNKGLSVLKKRENEKNNSLTRIPTAIRKAEATPSIDRPYQEQKYSSTKQTKNPGTDQNPEEYLVMGNTQYSEGRYREAIENYDWHLMLNPEDTTAWNNKGLALSKSGKIDEAISCYDKALEISRDCVVFNNKASALYRKGNIGEAFNCFESAFRLNKDSKTSKEGMDLCRKNMQKSHQ